MDFLIAFGESEYHCGPRIASHAGRSAIEPYITNKTPCGRPFAGLSKIVAPGPNLTPCRACAATIGVSADDLVFRARVEGVPNPNPAVPAPMLSAIQRRHPTWIEEYHRLTQAGRPDDAEAFLEGLLSCKRVPRALASEELGQLPPPLADTDDAVEQLEGAGIQVDPQLWAALEFWRGTSVLSDAHLLASIALAYPAVAEGLAIDPRTLIREIRHSAARLPPGTTMTFDLVTRRSINRAIDTAFRRVPSPTLELGVWDMLYAIGSVNLGTNNASPIPGQDRCVRTAAVDLLMRLHGCDPRGPLSAAGDLRNRLLWLTQTAATRLRQGDPLGSLAVFVTMVDGKPAARLATSLEPRALRSKEGEKSQVVVPAIQGALNRLGLVTSDALAEFSDLLARSSAVEADFQKFLEANDAFLRLLWPCDDVFPQCALTPQEDALRPDFVLVSQALSRAAIVELKRPQAPLIVGPTRRMRLSARMMEAKRQLDDYAALFRAPANARWLRAQYGSVDLKPHLFLVLGRSPGARGVERYREVRDDIQGMQILTYDELYQMAEKRAVRSIWGRRVES